MDAREITRRKFLLSSAAAIGTVTGTNPLGQTVQGAAPGSRRVLHVIATPMWTLPGCGPGGSSNLVLTTARSALDRINETPGFRYCHSSAIHYRWIQKADPAMFAEILHRIREGRWEVVGGWPVEPDCNLPATESFVRHALLVKLHFVIHWQQHEQILKLEIPTALTDPEVFAAVPGAVTEKATNGNEEPYQDWVAVQGKKNGEDYTVALLNNSTYSYDCLNGQLRTSLIRSAPYARHNPSPVEPDSLDAWQDQGRQERIFWLVGRAGSYTDLHLDQLGNELQTPAEYVMDSRHGGSEGWEKSFLDVAPSTISVLAIKQAEDSPSAMILRMQERSGKHISAHVESSLLQLNHDVSFNPWELKTLRIEPSKHATAKVREVSTLET